MKEKHLNIHGAKNVRKTNKMENSEGQNPLQQQHTKSPAARLQATTSSRFGLLCPQAAVCLLGGEMFWLPERWAEEEDVSTIRLRAAAEACQALLAMPEDKSSHRAGGYFGLQFCSAEIILFFKDMEEEQVWGKSQRIGKKHELKTTQQGCLFLLHFSSRCQSLSSPGKCWHGLLGHHCWWSLLVPATLVFVLLGTSSWTFQLQTTCLANLFSNLSVVL